MLTSRIPSGDGEGSSSAVEAAGCCSPHGLGLRRLCRREADAETTAPSVPCGGFVTQSALATPGNFLMSESITWAGAENSNPGESQVLSHVSTRPLAMNEDPEHDNSSMYSSTFAQVIFVNVEKLYMTDIPVKCNYTLTSKIEAHKKDWIGIFKVGWSTARDYHTFVWAPLPKWDSLVERQQQVTFEAYYLPKDENDFYQFCYVTQKGEIRGASTPFGFRLMGHSTSERLDSDSSQEMLIITTQEKQEETEREKIELKENNLKLVVENATLKEKIKELETQAAKEKEEHFTALEINKKEVTALEKQTLEQKVKSELEMKAQNEKAEHLRKNLTEKETACFNLQKEHKSLLAKMETSQASLEQLKQKHEKAVEKLKQLQQESKRLKVEISAKETELTSLTEVKNKTASELKAAQENLELVRFDVETQKRENEKLKENLKKLAEVQSLQQECVAEISRLRQALSKSEELKASNAKAIEQLQEQVEKLQQCLKEMEEKVEESRQQQAQTREELRAAQAAQQQSEKKLSEAQQEIQHWKSKFETVDQIFSRKEIRYTSIERELEDKSQIVDIRTMEVTALQEEIKKLNKKIDEMRFNSNHQSGTFKLEHPNPYSLSVPKVHAAHSGLLFGNPYSECDSQGSQTTEMVDHGRDRDAWENFQDIEEDSAVESQACPVCSMQFQANMDESDMEQHISTHFGHECPVCQNTFPESKLSQYENHVQSHFQETTNWEMI
ncbi:calcium-binding and coiled-coil domain-containing protein 2 [Amblyraja radiata]|uniref:calcium-binding and coiled-coil domain-containing protein 2 n=1 Tax=Amblyraja radiata TaxID=386614 RepID=UPI00140406C9|nr:calcium-binding and coiled-coil domain-containing protein 2 [Amblyraja radiata]